MSSSTVIDLGIGPVGRQTTLERAPPLPILVAEAPQLPLRQAMGNQRERSVQPSTVAHERANLLATNAVRLLADIRAGDPDDLFHEAAIDIRCAVKQILQAPESTAGKGEKGKDHAGLH